MNSEGNVLLDGRGNAVDLTVNLGSMKALQDATREFTPDGYGVSFLDFDMNGVRSTIYDPMWFAQVLACWKFPDAVGNPELFNSIFEGNNFLEKAQQKFLDGLEAFFTRIGGKFGYIGRQIRLRRSGLDSAIDAIEKKILEQERSMGTVEGLLNSSDAEGTSGTSSNTSQV